MAKLDKQFASIPKPTLDPAAMLQSLMKVIENVEVLTGQRGRGIKGVADQLTDLRSQAEGREARFTDYIEVSTANGEALAQRTTTLEAAVDDNKAEIARVDKAWADGDKAIARSVSTLRTEVGDTYATIQSLSETRSDLEGSIAQVSTDASAAFNGITANGNVKLVAQAGVGGYSSEYAWRLTAGDVYAGMSFLVKQNIDGSRESAVALTAQSFRFFDPLRGIVPVFDYVDGLYTFNVAVRFTDDVFAEKGISGSKIQERGITRHWFNRSEDNGDAQVTVQIREGSDVRIDCEYRGDPAQPYPFAQPHYLRLFRITPGGAATKIDEVPLQSFFAGNSDNRATYFTSTTMLTFDNPPAGEWTYYAMSTTAQTPVTVAVSEFYR